MSQRPFSKRSVTSRAAKAADRDQRESQLQQAAAELATGHYDSIRKAAAANNVPESTLRHRLSGRSPKKGAQAAQQLLTPAAETALLEHIRHCACSGYPLTPALLRQYATSITRPVPGCDQPSEVSHGWMQSFLLRHTAIRTHWSRCLDNARLEGATNSTVQQWFTQLAEIMRQYKVASTNVFNMDETGFIIGCAGSERVLVPSGDPATRFKAQPGTRESATVIECIGSGGQVLPPLIITKGVRHTVGDHRRMVGIPSTWHFTKSPNGWTNDELAVEWLETIFEPNTRPSTPSEYRLLIVDGHRSHTTSAFIEAAWKNRIIPLLLPAHTTHVMQPLDVSIFGPLTHAYRQLVSDAAQHVDDVNRAHFGTFYAQAREKVLTQARARKAFSDSGITLNPGPEKVLNRLAGSPRAAGASRSLERPPLQEIAVPRSASAFNATVDAYRTESDSREARNLKRSIMQAHEESQASIAVLEAEISVLRAQQQRQRKTSEKLGKKRARGDTRALTKDRIITRDVAERELVAKGVSIAENGGGNAQEEEEEAVLPPAGLVEDRDEAVIDGAKEVSSSLDTTTAVIATQIADMLDDGESLSAISDDDGDPYGFFETLPVAGPSRIKR